MNNFENDIELCLDALMKGNTILYPTDTVWGLGCDATNFDAVSKIFAIKKRTESKSLIVLLSDIEQIKAYTDQDVDQIRTYLEHALKPITVIYEKAKNLASNVINTDGTIGIRITKDPFCKMLIEKFGKPIVSTSANISGNATPHFFSEIDAGIIEHADYIVRYRQGDHSKNEPSMIIKLNSAGEIVVLRK